MKTIDNSNKITYCADPFLLVVALKIWAIFTYFILVLMGGGFICPYKNVHIFKTTTKKISTQCMIVLLFLLFSQIRMIWIDSTPSPIRDMGKKHPSKVRLIRKHIQVLISSDRNLQQLHIVYFSYIMY